MNQTKTSESQNFPAKTWDFSRCNEHTDVDSKIVFSLTTAWRCLEHEHEYSDFETLRQQYFDLVYNFLGKKYVEMAVININILRKYFELK